MDRLDEVLSTAAPLLRRVDDLLSTAGAPAGHPVWGELRRVRLLPGDAAHAVAALRPAAFEDAVPQFRAAAGTCVETAAALPDPGEWTGEAADAYLDLRARVAAGLSGGDESLDERLEATADLAQALTDWMARTRAALAAALADVLVSTEALTLSSAQASTPSTAESPPAVAETTAAAEVGAHLLRTIADDYAEASELLHGSRELADAIPM